MLDRTGGEPGQAGVPTPAVRSSRPISVAMATYNGGAYIGQQLASLAGQTRLPAELVVSDDGSTDDTLRLIEAFAKEAHFPIVVLPPHKRLGFSDNFLHAAEHCRGNYVAFCDQDDRWFPTKLERQLTRITADDSLLALHTLAVTDATLIPTGEIWDQDIHADAVIEPLALNPYRTGWGNSMLFDRRLLNLIDRRERPRQPEEGTLPLSHDTWILTLAGALGRVSHMVEPLLDYRQHGANTYGVGPVPWSIRVRIALLFHESRMREEAAFDDRLAALFDALAARPGEFAGAAALAATTYAGRADRCRKRLDAHLGGTVRERLGAFRQTGRDGEYAPTPKTRLKELVIGVSGVSRRFASLRS